MLVLLLLVIAVSCLYAITVRPRNGSGPGTRRRRRTPEVPPGAAAEDEPASLEGVLVTQLLTGEINRRQYRHAMGQLAARDEARHPMVVPPDGGVGEA